MRYVTTHRRSVARVPRLLLVATAAVIALGAVNWSATAQSRPSRRPVKGSNQPDKRWIEKLDRVDRAFLSELVGYAPPAFTKDLTWSGTPRRTWEELRGKVVVLHSWTNRTSSGRKVPVRIARTLADQDAEDVYAIFLHTPEGADSVQKFMERQKTEMPIVIDSSGVFCDELGVYKRPVNILVDRQGTVRYVGLNSRGLKEAVTQLVEEPFDPDKAPRVRPEPEKQPAASEFPPTKGGVGSAADLRGKQAPDFYVSRWYTDEPNARGKTVVIDFWATWCPPCRASIPHMNQLAREFDDDACFVGISDESSSNFKTGMRKYRLSKSDFDYALALDPDARMKKVFRVRGIPHCVVMSSDWIVRWQGHPMQLKAETLRQIVAADRGGTVEDPSARRKRWTR